jgi:hypothetical protein
MSLRPATFSLEPLGDRTFDGYTTGDTWNGWACPRFTFVQAQRLVKAYEENGLKAWYDEVADAFSFEVKAGNDLKEVDTFPVEELDGKQFYPVGAFCWIWESVTKS